MYKRKLYHQIIERLDESLPFMQAIIGPRQVGKSTLMEQVAQAIPIPATLVSCDQPSNKDFRWLEMVWNREAAHRQPRLLVIDEVQKVADWSETVKRLFDRDKNSSKLKIVILGSASLSIQKGLSESLAGRFELNLAHHWSFAECSDAFGWDLMTYLKLGGYPGAAILKDDTDRWQSYVLDSIIEPVISKDLQGIIQIRKPSLFRQTFDLAMHYPGQEISYQKLLGKLQDKGNAATIRNYLEILESAFLIRCLGKYSGSAIKVKSSSPKLLPMDTSLIHAYHEPSLIDSDPVHLGRVFECAVGAHLAKQGGSLYYWREGGLEVDYVWIYKEHKFAIEIKSGKMRNPRGLTAFVDKYSTFTPVVVELADGEELLSLEGQALAQALSCSKL